MPRLIVRYLLNKLAMDGCNQVGGLLGLCSVFKDGWRAGAAKQESAVKFRVGTITYTLVISDSSIYDAEGNEVEGIALEAQRLLLISRIVEPTRREEVAMHEYVHAWFFHVPRPTTEEENCQFAAFVAEQFNQALESQGGRDALRALPATRMPRLGSPPAQRIAPAAPEAFQVADRIPCGTCQSDIMCGSIVNGSQVVHQYTGQWWMVRWARCEACGDLQAWGEYCTPDGIPLGKYVSNPPPRMMRGAEAKQWLTERAKISVCA